MTITSTQLLLLSIGLSILSCLLVAYLIYKARQIHATLYRTDFAVQKLSLGVTRNLQYLEQLSHELALERPLPPLRGWAASPDVLLLLARRIRKAGPEAIVECGSGVSTIVQARAAMLNGHGHVYSIDHDSAFVDQTRQALTEYGLSQWATVTHAPLVQSEIGGTRWNWYDLPAVPDISSIDMLFIDGPPADSPAPLARYPAGPLLFPRLSPDASVFLDDSGRPGEAQVLKLWSAEFPNLEQVLHHCEKGCCELRSSAASAMA